jgi:hypothetical protein
VWRREPLVCMYTCTYITLVEYVWDDQKARGNLR